MQLDYLTMIMGVLGGLGMFLFGMTLLSQGLQSMGSQYIKRAIGFITQNRVLAVMVGLFVTAFVQSSSVSTVMMSSFLNAGLMNLTQGVGFVFGANIGTTITGWIISLQIGQYGLLLVGFGAIPFLFCSNQMVKNISKLFLALGFIFFGLECMSGAFKPLRDYQPFLDVVSHFDAKSAWSILACMGMGCFLTIIIQSSSAMLAITITLATQNAIGFETAAALVMGENIGTTITLWLASLSGGRITKQIALAHSSFNLSGSMVIFCIFPWYMEFIRWIMANAGASGYTTAVTAGSEAASNAGAYIATVHTMFNVILTIIYTPFLQYLVKFVEWIIPIGVAEKEPKLVFFSSKAPLTSFSPMLMLQQARIVIQRLNDDTSEAVELARDVLININSSASTFARIHEIENRADEIQKEVIIYLAKTMRFEPTEVQSKEIQALIHASDELESITDYCESISKYRQRLDENNIMLNAESREMLTDFLQQTVNFYSQSGSWIAHPEAIDLPKIMVRYQELNLMAERIKATHLQMIQDQKYPPLFALTFSDIMVAIRRIKNHTLNLAETQLSGTGKF